MKNRVNSQYLCRLAGKPEGGCRWGVGGLLEKSIARNSRKINGSQSKWVTRSDFGGEIPRKNIVSYS